MAIYEIYIDEGILVSDSNIIGVGGMVIENTQSSDEFLKNLFKVSNISETVNISDLTSSNRGVFVGVIETSLISDDDIVNSVLNALISEKALFSVRLNIHGYQVIGYVANARTGATSFYDNFNFNSFTQNNNSYFGCKGDGIYKMFESNSDAGNDIQARATTGLVDLYTNKLKSFSDAYLVAKNDGSLYIRVMSNNEWFTYKFDKDYSENFDISRANIGRGLKSVVWQFELINDNGSDFDLEAVKLYPLILSRSVG